MSLRSRQSCTPATEAGDAFVKVTLNPCGENYPIDIAGIPDGGMTDVSVIRCLDDLVLGPPVQGDSSSWGIIRLGTPYWVAQQIWVRYTDLNGAPAQETLRAYINGLPRVPLSNIEGAQFNVWFTPILMANEDLSNPNHPTITFDFGLAPFDLFIFRPSVLTDFTFAPDAPGWSWIRKVRNISKGITTHLNAPATATQGRMVVAQIGSETANKILAQDPDPVIGDIPTPYPARFTVTPLYAFNNLPQQDINCRQDVIKTGSYDIQRHWNESYAWNEVEDVRPIWRSSAANLAPVWRLPVAINPVTPPLVINSQVLMKYDLFDVNLGWDVAHINGLSYQATIHYKLRSFWETNTPGDSPWAAQRKPPCPYDAGALSCAKMLGPVLPHSFEAKYNDWGLLGTMLTKMVPSIVSGGASLIQGLLAPAQRQVPNSNVIDDPYHGKSLYGYNGYMQPRNGNGNGNGNSRRRRRR